MIKIPSSSVAKDLKDVRITLSFDIKDVKKATRTYGGYYTYFFSVYIGKYRIINRAKCEASNIEELKEKVNNFLISSLIRHGTIEID